MKLNAISFLRRHRRLAYHLSFKCLAHGIRRRNLAIKCGKIGVSNEAIFLPAVGMTYSTSYLPRPRSLALMAAGAGVFVAPVMLIARDVSIAEDRRGRHRFSPALSARQHARPRLQ